MRMTRQKKEDEGMKEDEGRTQKTQTHCNTAQDMCCFRGM